jgi:formylmethanofuran dehydrogenase subunit B
VCDDVSLEVQDGQLTRFAPGCQLGESWFRRHWQAPGCLVTVDGQPSGLDAAIDRAAEILQQSAYPLVYGLSRGATAGQRAAVELAEKLGGVVDSTASMCHGPSIMAIQEVGEVTSTLGEIRNRADLVIFWGCNPASSHPRHAERYSVHPEGKLTSGGRSDRTVVMVGDEDFVDDWRLDPDGGQADMVIPLKPGSDFEALSELRALLNGRDDMGSNPDLRRLMDLMKGCRYGVVFFGLGLAKTNMWQAQRNSSTGHVDVAALLKLVSELNAVTRFTARRMRLQGDVSGADNVLCWQTSYPFGVDFSRGYPRYNPGEYTANDLLERGDVDACLLVGAETVQYFTDQAKQYLESIPTILVDYPNAECPVTPDVQITTAVHGIHVPGTIYRMDNVPMNLRSMHETDLPTDQYVLNQIRDRCEQGTLV